MNIKHDNYLVKHYPHVFADRHASLMVTNMCWGFDCGDGWFKIIKEASEKLEPLIVKLIEEYPDAKNYFPRASQVKEKYGALRFYLTSGTDEMRSIIAKAERKSSKICELCGKPGKLRGKELVYTRCEKHKEH